MIGIIARTIAVAAIIGMASSAYGASSPPPPVTLTLKSHRFTPATLTVPAGVRLRVTLINRDPATEEFDSHDLRLEQVVTPMGKVSFDIGPLRPGQYSFMGEFHPSTAVGKINVMAAGH